MPIGNLVIERPTEETIVTIKDSSGNSFKLRVFRVSAQEVAEFYSNAMHDLIPAFKEADIFPEFKARAKRKSVEDSGTDTDDDDDDND